MIYHLGDSYYSEFVTSDPNTGSAKNADYMPIATSNTNGLDNTSFILTVINIDTGRYNITGIVPLSMPTDSITNISIEATVSGIAGKAIVDTFRTEDISISELYDLVDSNPSSIISGIENSAIIAKELTSQSILNDITLIQLDLKRLLGLMHENIYIDLATYDMDGNMIAARVRIYSDPDSVGTINNIIGEYEISCDAISPGKFNSWKQIKI